MPSNDRCRRVSPSARRGSAPDRPARCHAARTGPRGPRCAASVLAATITPEVSLSSRCTMPGRATPPIPERLGPQCANSALTRVPVSLPGAGWAAMPAGLSTTIRCASSNSTVERDRLRLRDRPASAAGSRSGSARATPWPRRRSPRRRRRDGSLRPAPSAPGPCELGRGLGAASVSARSSRPLTSSVQQQLRGRRRRTEFVVAQLRSQRRSSASLRPKPMNTAPVTRSSQRTTAACCQPTLQRRGRRDQRREPDHAQHTRESPPART